MVIHQSRLWACCAAFLFVAAPAIAQNNVSLENLTSRAKDGKTVLNLPRVDVVNTNLSRGEVAQLFSSDALDSQTLALAARMTADKVTISGAALEGDGAKISLGAFEAAGIREGHFAKITLDGFSGTFSGKGGAGGGSITGRALLMENGNFAPVIAAIQTNNLEAAAFQVGRVVWSGFSGAFTDSETPAGAPGGNQIKVSLQGLTVDSQYSGNTPVSGKVEAVGLVLDPTPSSEFGKGLRAFGYERVELGLSGAGRYDAATQKLVLEDYTITSPQAGRLSLSGEMSGIDAAALSSTDATQRGLALLGSSIEGLKLNFVNEGLVDKGFAFAAAKQGKSAAALRSEVSSMAVQLLPLLLGGDPQSLSLAQSVQTFVTTPRNFSLSLKARGAPVPVARLSAIRDPATFLALVNVSLSVNQ
ncbi:MAG: hypothetical protein JWO64_2026 [Hyphomicrobiales bacterium]|jgi:hypothetical protein|nr:hypothetical protein [Hyphomicrobiales bacterium]